MIRRRRGLHFVASSAIVCRIVKCRGLRTSSCHLSVPLPGLPRNSFTLPLYFGRGFVLPFGFLPFPVPLDVVVGEPVHVPKFEGESGAAWRLCFVCAAAVPLDVVVPVGEPVAVPKFEGECAAVLRAQGRAGSGAQV